MPDSDGSRTMTQRGKAASQPWVATATFTSAFHLHSRLPQLGTSYLSRSSGPVGGTLSCCSFTSRPHPVLPLSVPDAFRFHILLQRYMSMSRADGDGDGDRLACKWAECYRQ